MDAGDKRLAGLQARAAMRGHRLLQTLEPDGRVVYVLAAWNVTRDLPDLDAAERVLDVVAPRREEVRT